MDEKKLAEIEARVEAGYMVYALEDARLLIAEVRRLQIVLERAKRGVFD